ncbi:MAG: site-specific DNA-methyltransferase [Desulfobacter sp.]
MRKEIIGDCELYLGSCLDIIESISPIDSIVTDPPFGMGYQSGWRKEQHEKIQNDESDELLRFSCALNVQYSKYIFCRWDNLFNLPNKPSSLITWVKNNHTSGDLEHQHARQTENILFYPGPYHTFPKKRPADVIYCPKVSSNSHPTEKPEQLMRVLCDWTTGTVVDPFMGSGTTGVSCAKLKRKFIGVELEQKYFDIACKRIENAYKELSLF